MRALDIRERALRAAEQVADDSDADRDALLTELLVSVYPTPEVQNA